MLVRVGNEVYEAPAGTLTAVWYGGSWYRPSTTSKGVRELEPLSAVEVQRAAAAPQFGVVHPLEALRLQLRAAGRPVPWEVKGA